MILEGNSKLPTRSFSGRFAISIGERCGFEEEVLSFGPMRKKPRAGFQLDLIYFRTGKNITLCELKFSSTEISPTIISEVAQKISKLQVCYPNHSIQTALITTIGCSKSLHAAKYFDYVINATQIIGKRTTLGKLN